MSTESHQRLHSKEQVYAWIDELQQDPKNEEIQTNLVLQYQDLVHSLARKFSKGKSIHDDLVQVGMIGLLAAF